MNSWSARRRRVIFLLTLLCLVILVGVPLFFFFHKAPTCSDNTQNGDETGIDCGGSCRLLCKAETLPILMKGDARVLRIATSTYEVVGSFQNPNIGAKVVRAQYVFKLYGIGSVPIKTIEGSTFVAKGKDFAVFEGPFELTETPVRATFEWVSGSLVWEKDPSIIPELTIKEGILSNGSEPRLDAEVANPTLERIANIELTALLFDANGNIIAASKTLVENLEPGESAPLLFTWPRSFTSSTTAVEILPRILPDKSYIR
ncbi:MAG: hypothetical protein JWN89_697 [Parcubacteria group bacterium]|nr:hypothetical protein [Parcubacteria group bacterium]